MVSPQTAPAEVRIARAVESCLRQAMAGREVRIDRDREAPLGEADLPAVQIFSDGSEAVEDYIGGMQMRAFRLHVESVADRGDLEPDVVKRPAASADDAITQMVLCEAALLIDRTLGGVCCGLTVAPAEAGRTAVDTKASTARAEAITVSAYFVR